MLCFITYCFLQGLVDLEEAFMPLRTNGCNSSFGSSQGLMKLFLQAIYFTLHPPEKIQVLVAAACNKFTIVPVLSMRSSCEIYRLKKTLLGIMQCRKLKIHKGCSF